MLDLGKQFGLRNLLMRMNLTLAEELQRVSDVYLLDAQRWIEGAGQAAYNPKLWFLTKTPFHPEVFRRAADDIKAALRSLQGEAKKVIVLDLDNTLWGGIVGDVGWELLKIGGHDYIGEAYREFQLRLKALTRRGILLAICSHNTEEVALEALRQHPELVLRPEDFAARRINWHDKAANIVELAAELNVGLESMVFIDDNPTERGRVREALPQVLVPNWPQDPTQFATCLLQMDCFDVPAVSEEDAERGRMYSNRRCGQELKASLSSAEEWLAALQTQVSVEELTSANRSRVVQLLNKTNQLNLSTRRLHEGELLKWLEEGRRKLWAIRVSDRFGDSGLTGILTVEIQQGGAQVVDFVLSCRVMGRNIERVMLSIALNYCRSVGVDRLSAIYRPTARNKPCLEFLLDSRADYDASTQTFVWAVNQQLPVAEGIKVSFTPGAAITSTAQSAATQSCTADRHEHSSVAC
jgi:FkbH-like protein